MRKVVQKGKPRALVWWLSGGEEVCSYCGQLYPYELEFRCSQCDAPSCPQCRMEGPGERHTCPGCAEDDAHG